MSTNPHELIAVKRGCNCFSCPIATLREGVPLPQDYGISSTFTRGSQYPVDGIILVGEIPTFNDKRGPLSGRAKRNWQEALDKSGLAGLNLLLVPTAHCVPDRVFKKTNRPKIVKSCMPSPQFDLTAYPTVPVLLMGGDAMEAYGLDLKINETRGFLNNVLINNEPSVSRPFIITYAATTVMFGNIYMWGTFIEDLRRFYRLITNTLKPGLLPSMVKIHASDEDIAKFVRRSDGQAIAVDIETTSPGDNPEWGLDPTRASLKTIALGRPDYAVSLAWNNSDYASRKFVANILANNSIIKVFHNGPWFDLRILERYDLPVVNWEDTRDLRRAISSTSRLSLGYLGSLYCDIHAWKLDDSSGKKATSNNLDELLLYNGYDTIVTARIFDAMKHHLEAR